MFEHEICVVHLWLPGDLSGFTRNMHPPGFKVSWPRVCKANARSSARPSFTSQSSSSLNLREHTLKPGEQTTVYLPSPLITLARGPWTCPVPQTQELPQTLKTDSLPGTFFSLTLFLKVPTSKSKEIRSPYACLLRLQWASGLFKRHMCFTVSWMQVPLWWLQTLGFWLVPDGGQPGLEEKNHRAGRSTLKDRRFVAFCPWPAFGYSTCKANETSTDVPAVGRSKWRRW